MADILTIADRIGLPNHLKIIRKEDKNDPNPKSFTVFVNPESYTINYGQCYSNLQPIGETESTHYFNKTKEQTMSINILFDSTGSLGKIPIIANEGVLEQIESFLDIAYTKDGKFPEGKEIQLVWGPMEFKGVLKTVSISYTHFDHTGAPIRATAACSFAGGEIDFQKSPSFIDTIIKRKKPKKFVDFGAEMHAINAIVKLTSYVAVVGYLDPEAAKPKSLRLAEEVAKLIIK